MPNGQPNPLKLLLTKRSAAVTREEYEGWEALDPKNTTGWRYRKAGRQRTSFEETYEAAFGRTWHKEAQNPTSWREPETEFVEKAFSHWKIK